ncbi:glycosyltransferase family 39 protein [bacterium]|nr:glycosyltransferase family 39 protein [bacterium]
MMNDERPRFCHEWILALLIALTAALRLFHLEYRSFWTDEFRTLYSIRLPLGELIGERLSYGHFPTYFILLKYWAAVFGEAEWALRLPSLICVVFAAIYVFLIARKAWSLPAAAWGTLFFALNGRGIWAAQEARPYGLVILAAAASLHALANALEKASGGPRTRSVKNFWWLAYVFWSALGLVSHATYLFIFMGQSAVTGWWLWRRRLPRWDWIAAILALAAFTAVAYGWLAEYAAHHINKAYSEESLGLNPKLFREGLLEVFWGDYRLAIGSGFKYIGMLMTAGLMWLAWRGARDKQIQHQTGQRAPMFGLALAWAVSIIVVMGVVSAVKQDVVRDSRYFAPGLGGACLLMGLGVGAIRGKLQYVLGGIVIIFLGINAVGWLWSPGEQVRHAVQYVAAHRAQDEPVLFCKGTNSALMAEYYHLGTVPKGFDREEADPDALRKQVEEYVGSAPGFWLILYKEENSPIVSVIQAWVVQKTGIKYSEIKEQRFAKVGVMHWRRK